MADATTLTEAGYVGEDVENIILKLYDASFAPPIRFFTIHQLASIVSPNAKNSYYL